jgi:hypothetical protein
VYPQPVVSVAPLRVPIALDDVVQTLGGKKSKQQAEEKTKLQQLLLDNSRAAHLEALTAEVNAMTAAKICDLPEEAAELSQRMEVQRDNVDRQLVKHLQDACVASDIPRALNICLAIRGMETLGLAITVANHFGAQTVAMALQSILEFKRAQEEERLLAAQPQVQYLPAPEQEQQEQYYESPPQQQGHSQQDDDLDYSQPPAARTGLVSQSQRRKHAASIGDGSGIANADEDEDDDVFGDHDASSSSSNSAPKQPQSSNYNSFFAAKVPSNAAGSKHAANTVSPMVAGSAGTGSSPSRPINPFAVKSTGTTPIKRKSAYAGMQDLKASPSPAKKPALSRTSTFSAEARRSKHSEMRLL